MITMKAYIIHYTPLVERKPFIEKAFELEKIEHEYILEYDKENLLEKNIIKFRSSLNKKYISNFLKHLSAIEKISKSNNKINLIVEDDAILCDDFKEKLLIYYNELPTDFDFLFLGGEPDKRWDVPDHMIRSNTYCYSSKSFLTKTLDAYLISIKTAKELINYYNKTSDHSLHIETDHWINQYIKEKNCKVYWCYPRLVKHGSAIKKFKSSLR